MPSHILISINILCPDKCHCIHREWKKKSNFPLQGKNILTRLYIEQKAVCAKALYRNKFLSGSLMPPVLLFSAVSGPTFPFPVEMIYWYIVRKIYLHLNLNLSIKRFNCHIHLYCTNCWLCTQWNLVEWLIFTFSHTLYYWLVEKLLLKTDLFIQTSAILSV